MAGEKDPVLSASAEASDRQAFDDIKRQRDEAVATAATVTGALDSMMKVHDASRALMGKVADPFTTAEMISNRLTDVPRENVVAHVTSDEFAPVLAAFRGVEAPPTPPEGEPAGQPPATESAGNGFGPSPGLDSGSKPLDGVTTLIQIGSPEYKALLTDPAAMEKAIKENRVAEPTRTF
jgi:hypothetical protein